MNDWKLHPLKTIMSRGTAEQQAKVINWWLRRDKFIVDLIENYDAEIIQTEIDK